MVYKLGLTEDPIHLRATGRTRTLGHPHVGFGNGYSTLEVALVSTLHAVARALVLFVSLKPHFSLLCLDSPVCVCVFFVARVLLSYLIRMLHRPPLQCTLHSPGS